MFNTEQNRINQYQTWIASSQVTIQSLKKKIDFHSLLRLGFMILEIICFIAMVSTNNEVLKYTFALSLIIPVFLFIYVVKQQSKLTKALNFNERLLTVYLNEFNVLTNKENCYADGSEFDNETHTYQSDLDIFGKFSIYSLINRSATRLANQLLAKHLLAPLPKFDIIARQKAIQELLQHINSTFIFRALLVNNSNDRIAQLKEKIAFQLKEQVSFTEQKFLRVYAKLIPYLMLFLGLFGAILGGVFWQIFAIFFVTNLFLNFRFGKQINKAYYGISGTANILNTYAEAIAWTEGINWKSSYFHNFFQPNQIVSHKIKALTKIVVAFDARLNILLYAFLNYLLLWDVRCCIKLNNWCKDVGEEVSNGLDSISYFEELIGFATFGFNHPAYVFPVIKDEYALNATAIGHPLLPIKHRVNNHFNLADKPTVDIITGSNMAGKSTFLRTIGVNMILAYTGSVVAAKKFELSIFNVVSYMRIRDNLIESTSTFKAELNRLKMILNEIETKRNNFVLIDEMLRGTNSKDKFDGSSAFIEQLIQLQVPAFFATHDLQLSELALKYPNQIRNFHFDIQLNQNDMAFDYKIKSGPCTQFNAAILLKQIGLSLH